MIYEDNIVNILMDIRDLLEDIRAICSESLVYIEKTHRNSSEVKDEDE